jgi:[ribosomal protein S5]-alanine N-acetyltransferase
MKKFLIGKRISLHGLSENDMTEDSPYYNWLDDLSLDLFTERSYFPNTLSRIQSFYEESVKNKSLVLLGIYDNESGKHIGNITFSEINWIQRRAFIAYLLGDKSFGGKGIVTEAVLMMMYYGFNKLNFERIWGGVSVLHAASSKICEKTGLKVEGRMRNHLYRNGEFSDALVVGAIRSEWMNEFGDVAKNLFEELPTY